MRSIETSTAAPDRDEEAIPREVEVVYTGDDGHIYISEGDGRRSRRLTWSPEDFSTVPGMPPLPGVCGPLEDGLVFTNPVASACGERVAVFGLLPTLLDDRELYPWEPWMDDGDFEEEEWQVVPSEESESGEPSDVVGSGMVLVVYGDSDDDDAEVETLERGDDDDEELPAYWPGSRVYVIHRDGVRVWEPWSQEEGTAIHLEWAPDDEHLMVLHQESDLMHLDLVPFNGEGEDIRIASGAPLFWAWQPGGRRLAVRTDHPEDNQALLHLCDPLDNMDSQLVGPAGSFYAPAWHPEGKALVYGQRGEREDSLALVDPQGEHLRDLFTYPGRAAFRWDPRGSQLAVALAPEGHGPFQALQLLELDGETRTLWRGAFICFQWLRDGSGFLICESDLEQGHLRWLLLRPDGTTRSMGVPFVPTRETAVALHFFEQVAPGQPFLSPGEAFVTYAGYPVEKASLTEEDAMPLGIVGLEPEDQRCRILITPVGGSETVAVGEGRYACFPRPPSANGALLATRKKMPRKG